MSNPFLPLQEYIPDGEPRVFGNRVYIYGSHDRADSDSFCDYKLKVWSASIDNLNEWVCHGDIFHTLDDEDHLSDTAAWTKNNELYAPDVVEKDGKYYLYAYIMNAKGCVGVSDTPEGPFQLLSKYQYIEDQSKSESFNGGWFIDPGVIVDDDGRVYVYCGYQNSFMAEINSENMYEIIDGSVIDDIIPMEEPFCFFEACSPRKIGDVYYLIYSPTNPGSKLVYATSNSPTGPFQFRGTIVNNGQDYPGGNNHGSICKIKDQWYIFYHRMTNGTIMSRRACVEKIEIQEDGTIEEVEMTSLGFETALNPYKITPAEIACVLRNGCIVTEKNTMERVITNITHGAVMGYKYFDFGKDSSSKTMEFCVKIIGKGCSGILKIYADNTESECIGAVNIGTDDAIISTRIRSLIGVHAIYFVVEDTHEGWFKDMFTSRAICDIVNFVFVK